MSLDPPSSLTTSQYIDYMQDMYDLDVSLKAFLFDKGEMTEMPRSDTKEYGKWLEDHGHNIISAKIILLPDLKPPKGIAKYENINFISRENGGGDYPSPYYQEYSQMVIKLGMLFESTGLISTKRSLVGLEKYKKPLYGLLGSHSDLLMDKLSDLKNGAHFGFRAYNLDVLRLLLEGKLEEHYSDNPSTKQEKINELKSIFYEIYDIAGFSHNNHYVTELRYTLQKIGFFFGEKIENIGDIIGHMKPSGFWDAVKAKRSNKPRKLPKIIERLALCPINYILKENGYGERDVSINTKFIEDLSLLVNSEGNIEEKMKKLEKLIYLDYFFEDSIALDDATETKIKDLMKIINPYLKQVLGYYILEFSLSSHADSSKKTFFTNLLLDGNLYDLPQHVNSRLLFGSSTTLGTHMASASVHDLQQYTLERLKFSIDNWQLTTFNKISKKDFTHWELASIQDAMINNIDQYILDNYLDSSIIKTYKVKTYRKHSLFTWRSLTYEALTNIIFGATLRDVKEKGKASIIESIRPLQGYKKLGPIFDITEVQANYLYKSIYHISDPSALRDAKQQYSEALQKIYKKIAT